MPSIPIRDIDDDPELWIEDLDREGCLVVTRAMSDDLRTRIEEQLAPHMARAEVGQDKPEDFYPGGTRRVSALVSRCEASHELILHPASTAVCDRLLLPQSPSGYQLHVTAALEVGPGSRKQILHREDGSFGYFPRPHDNLIVATMWAVSDFRADNGGTLLVPGSHRWEEDRVAKEDEIVTAEMPAGSVLYWLGSTLHGAGANISEGWRYGVILTYSLGWLRQEENQYVDVPLERAARLSGEMKKIIGYEMYDAHGFFDPRVMSE